VLVSTLLLLTSAYQIRLCVRCGCDPPGERQPADALRGPIPGRPVPASALHALLLPRHGRYCPTAPPKSVVFSGRYGVGLSLVGVACVLPLWCSWVRDALSRRLGYLVAADGPLWLTWTCAEGDH